MVWLENTAWKYSCWSWASAVKATLTNVLALGLYVNHYLQSYVVGHVSESLSNSQVTQHVRCNMIIKKLYTPTKNPVTQNGIKHCSIHLFSPGVYSSIQREKKGACSTNWPIPDSLFRRFKCALRLQQNYRATRHDPPPSVQPV
jgi:hypothetical protein